MNPTTEEANRLIATSSYLLDEACIASEDSFFIFDLSGRYLYLSPKVAELGFDRSQLIGKSWRDFGLAPAVSAQIDALFQEVVRSDHPLQGELDIPIPNGSRRYRYCFSPLHNPAGSLIAIALVGKDITPEWQAEQARRESEELYRALSEGAFEGIVLHENGRILEANEAAAKLFGYSREELVGMPILALAPPEGRQRVEEATARGLSEPYEAIGLRKDGSTFVGELHGKDVTYRGRRVRVTAMRDLTERLEMERELREAEARWRSVVEGSPDIIGIIEPDGRIAYLNRSVPSLPVDQVIGKPLYDIIAEPYREATRAAYRQVFEHGVPQSFEFEAPGSDGGLATYQTRVVPLKVGDRIPCALSVSTDITPIRQASIQLAHQAVALEQAHELNQIKANFVNAVSHELRTPLTSIFGYLEFLEDRIGGDLTTEQLEFVTEIRVSAQRLRRLVDDLLDFARLEAGTFSLHQQPVDLRIPVQDALRGFRPVAEDRDIQLETGPLPEPLMTCADAERLGQVLGNLVSNALKFTPSGGRVRIEAGRMADGTLRVAVRDTGIGIDPAERPRLFQRFSQLEAGLRSGKGTGLGLSISKAIVEAHGGLIGVDSAPGQGSTFWFTLPEAAARPDCGNPA